MHHEDFDRFWAAYPRRVGKGKARKAFEKAIKTTTLAAMLDALAWQRNQPQWVKDGGEYVPHPTTWLNQERWADEPFEVPQVNAKNARTFAAAESWARRG